MKRTSASSRLINWFRKKSMLCVIITLVIIYFIINGLFGCGYYLVAKDNRFHIPESSANQANSTNNTDNSEQLKLVDSLYFSFITASTVGFGDYYPETELGKYIVVGQSIFCSVYIAVMMSVITSKFLWPAQDTVYFSKKILFNPDNNSFQVRMINTNSMPIINPEIRITITEHAVGDVIAGVLELDNCYAKPTYLGRHDFTLTLGKGYIFVEKERISETCFILKELKKALTYQENAQKTDSRFRVTITISGSNGVQNIAELYKYYATDFVCGSGFAAIKYEEKDANSLGILYKRIPGLWGQFDSIKNEREIDWEKTCI